MTGQKMDKSLTETEWKARLTSEQYRVLREAGTERPWTSPLNEEKRPGEFVCAGCGAVCAVAPALPIFLQT